MFRLYKETSIFGSLLYLKNTVIFLYLNIFKIRRASVKGEGHIDLISHAFITNKTSRFNSWGKYFALKDLAPLLCPLHTHQASKEETVEKMFCKQRCRKMETGTSIVTSSEVFIGPERRRETVWMAGRADRVRRRFSRN